MADLTITTVWFICQQIMQTLSPMWQLVGPTNNSMWQVDNIGPFQHEGTVRVLFGTDIDSKIGFVSPGYRIPSAPPSTDLPNTFFTALSLKGITLQQMNFTGFIMYTMAQRQLNLQNKWWVGEDRLSYGKEVNPNTTMGYFSIASQTQPHLSSGWWQLPR